MAQEPTREDQHSIWKRLSNTPVRKGGCRQSHFSLQAYDWQLHWQEAHSEVNWGAVHLTHLKVTHAVSCLRELQPRLCQLLNTWGHCHDSSPRGPVSFEVSIFPFQHIKKQTKTTLHSHFLFKPYVSGALVLP